MAQPLPPVTNVELGRVGGHIGRARLVLAPRGPLASAGQAGGVRHNQGLVKRQEVIRQLGTRVDRLNLALARPKCVLWKKKKEVSRKFHPSK